MAGKFELKKSSNGKFMFNLKAGNNEVILTSQLYENKQGAEEGIASVKHNAELDDRFERKTGPEGKPHFVLRSANNEVIGKSEVYASRGSMERGIASVKKNAPEAAVEDLADGVRKARAGAAG
ncbi:MAG: YegP family protein [Acidobacteriaceae bacterium]|nr:YegP family protein [Acidobacteriaceae bacterium]